MSSDGDGDVTLNVVEVCEEAKRLLTSHWKMKDQTGSEGSEEHVALHWTNNEVDRRLWSDIANNTAQVDARSILLNIEIAAAHVRLLITKVCPPRSCANSCLHLKKISF